MGLIAMMSKKLWRSCGRFAVLGFATLSQSPLSTRLQPKNAKEKVTGSSWIGAAKIGRMESKPIIVLI